MMGFSHITQIRVSHAVIAETMRLLRRAGADAAEGVVLWAGNPCTDHSFAVSCAIFPPQEVIRSAQGVGVLVPSDALHSVNMFLYERDLRVIAQVHSHPREAYHSPTDDAFAIATVAGSISVVVPDFAARSFSSSRCAVYRLGRDGVWSLLPANAAAALIMAVE